MKLKSVQILGFRSIEKMVLPIEGNGHKILVGKNESGKSNIVKALKLLSENTSFGDKDKKELYEDKAHIAFCFSLDEDEINRVKKEFYRRFTADKQRNIAGDMTIEQFTKEFSKYVYYIIRFKQKKIWAFMPLGDGLKINDNWYRLASNFVSDMPEYAEEYSSVSYVNYDDFIDPENVEMLKDQGYISSITLKEIRDDLNLIVQEIVVPDESYIFPVIHWEYSAKEHDLPPTVDRNSFVENPSSCIPLKGTSINSPQ